LQYADIFELNCHCRQKEITDLGIGQELLKKENIQPTDPPTLITPSNTPIPQTPTTFNTPLPVTQTYGPTGFPQNINPLTGLEVENPNLLERRPMAVKVQIFPRGQRPPWGVSSADIIYDYYQNNGMTRFHAIFYGKDAEKVGPIRSARMLDKELVQMYKSVFAFGGADRRILNRLIKSDISNKLVLEGYGKCPPMCRIDPNGYNYLVTNTEEMSNYATENGMENVRQNLDGMLFNSELPGGGQNGIQTLIRISISAYTRWDFDSASGSYLRFQDTDEANNAQSEVYAPLVDRANNQQITSANVVILIVPHKYFYRSKSGTSEIIDIKLTGTGKAYAFRDGQVYELTWNRPDKNSVLYLTYSDGSNYPYKPGNTWYEVVGETSKVTQLQDGIWRFDSAIP
jgi:hypothetical protein